MDTFRVPIRFTSGEIEKIQDDTDEYYAQLLALTTQIIPGELPLIPDYGVADPVFSQEAKEQLAFNAGAFIPEIIIDNVELNQNVDGTARIVIGFTRRSE